VTHSVFDATVACALWLAAAAPSVPQEAVQPADRGDQATKDVEAYVVADRTEVRAEGKVVGTLVKGDDCVIVGRAEGKWHIEHRRYGRVVLSGWIPRNDVTTDANKTLGILSEMIEKDPKNAHTHILRGHLLLRRFGNHFGAFNAAMEDLDAAVKIDPQNASFRSMRGFAADLWGYDVEAIEDYTEAIRLEADEPTHFLQRGLLLLRQRKYDRALDDLNTALNPESKLQLAPHPQVLAYRERCRARAFVGDFGGARQDYEAERKLMGSGWPPKAGDDFERWREVYLDLGQQRYQEVVDRTGKQIAQWRNDRGDKFPSDQYLHRGMAFASLQKFAEALADYTAAFEATEDTQALYNRAWLRATCPDKTIRDARKAIDDAESAVPRREKVRQQEEQEPTWQMLAALAAAFAEGGNLKKASEQQKKAVEAAPRPYREVLLEIDKVYQQGRPLRAIGPLDFVSPETLRMNLR